MARILVADDNADQVRLQRNLLEAIGYEVGTAATPAETLLALERSAPDLIIMDLRFPNVCDGVELIRDIRARGRGMPVIVLSGWPDDLYGSPEEQLVSRILIKGSVHELMRAIEELLVV